MFQETLPIKCFLVYSIPWSSFLSTHGVVVQSDKQASSLAGPTECRCCLKQPGCTIAAGPLSLLVTEEDVGTMQV